MAMVRVIPLFAAQMCASYVVDPGGARFHVNPSTGRILDSHGRERLFHGTNIVYKKAPFHPSRGESNSKTSFVAEDMALLASMGYNTIRLGATWAGTEPVEGQYNETFLDVVADIVSEAGQNYGIFSVLDHHQDAYSTAVCGTGFPSWTVADTEDKFLYKLLGKKAAFPAPISESLASLGYKTEVSPGEPNVSVCTGFNRYNWPEFHLTFQTSLSYEEVYQNVRGKRDKFAAYWAHVAKRFANSSYVLGYELMNEPFSGDPYRYPLNLIPGVADRTRFQKLYDQLNGAIRAEDPDRLIFFQSVTWEVGLPIGELFGFDHVPGGREFANRSVLSFHNSVLGKYTPDDVYYKWRRDEAKRLGCAFMVTENGQGRQLDRTDEFVAGWMHWDYKIFANWTWDNGGIMDSSCEGGASRCVNPSNAKSYVRAYPMAVAGNIRSVEFNTATGEGHFSYTPSPAATAPTVLFVPERWYYEEGYDLTVEPRQMVTWNASQDYVTIYHQAGAEAACINVSIRPKMNSPASLIV
eukprot:TRINITY_DN27933_c0_g6_i1.p1 TRINITY_DN27933_c0_g6~~TRINITY_DN27933_c0_g6_i1.p1  ORF type:complete len:546 (-),score=52.37 TRINITY_DN27933_c0_g6_i1:255-1823(-)